MKTILLDVDGVLADFVGGCCALFNVNEAKLYANWPPGLWDFFRLFGQTKSDFYGGIARAGAEFWHGLPAYPHAAEFLQFCMLRADTYFCTTPTRDAGSLSGKRKWLEGFCGPAQARRAIFTEEKWLVAGPDKLLIDDCDANVFAFREHGGDAILWPARWNSRHAEHHCAADTVKAEVIAWLSN